MAGTRERSGRVSSLGAFVFPRGCGHRGIAGVGAAPHEFFLRVVEMAVDGLTAG